MLLFISCNKKINNDITLKVQVLNKETFKPLSNVDVTILQIRKPLLGMKEFHKIENKKTNALGMVLFEVDDNKEYCLWFEKERKRTSIDYLLIEERLINDSIIIEM